MALQKGARLLTPFAGCGIDLPRSGGGARNALTPGYCLSRLRREIHLSALQAGGGVPPVVGAGGCSPAAGFGPRRRGRSGWVAAGPLTLAPGYFRILFPHNRPTLLLFSAPPSHGQCMV